MISGRDRTILSALAEQYRELCDSDANQDKIQLWRNLNNLTSVRPLVYCNTGLLGGEIQPHLKECEADDQELESVEW